MKQKSIKGNTNWIYRVLERLNNHLVGLKILERMQRILIL
jgi:hypothetical protein